ncbi:uncharacterized protein LOC120366832 [Saimiri boliviensis]|uniref:uncharacterized protein LOC120366832 n=1 Tax=Saimiri boliviensis TaxID=27679 RepID=UPI00193E8AA2|nr:translation initiation factor IF-2-like [Saimiri boliviensis boliviensis]
MPGTRPAAPAGAGAPLTPRGAPGATASPQAPPPCVRAPRVPLGAGWGPCPSGPPPPPKLLCLGGAERRGPRARPPSSHVADPGPPDPWPPRPPHGPSRGEWAPPRAGPGSDFLFRGRVTRRGQRCGPGARRRAAARPYLAISALPEPRPPRREARPWAAPSPPAAGPESRRAGGGSNGRGALLALFSQGGRRLARGTKWRRRSSPRARGAARRLRGGRAGAGRGGPRSLRSPERRAAGGPGLLPGRRAGGRSGRARPGARGTRGAAARAGISLFCGCASPKVAPGPSWALLWALGGTGRPPLFWSWSRRATARTELGGAGGPRSCASARAFRTDEVQVMVLFPEALSRAWAGSISSGTVVLRAVPVGKAGFQYLSQSPALLSPGWCPARGLVLLPHCTD